MFFIRIIHFLLGYVRVQATGGSPERFLTWASRAGVNLWGIRRREGVLVFCVRARRFKRLRPAVRRSHVRLEILRRRGVPFWFHRYRRRHGILVGLVVFLAVIWFFSGFVWTVNIEGNKNVPTQDISEVLTELGMKPGTYRLFLNVREIEEQTLMRLPDLSWISINMRGSSAVVSVRERVYPNELVPYNVPCNILASQTGQIVKLETYEGMPLVRQGDTVKKGDVVVSGVIEEKSGALRYAHARAQVLARTPRTLKETVPLKKSVAAFTGKNVSRRELYLLGLNIPLHFGPEPQGSFARTVTDAPAVLFGMQLPVGVRTTEFKEFRTQTVTLTSAQAEQAARAQLTKDEAAEFSGDKVESRAYTVQRSPASVTVTGRYSCVGEIGYEAEVKIS